MHPFLTHRNYLRHRDLDRPESRKPKKTLAATLRQWTKAAMNRWQRRKMIAALEAMDDALLRDIGIYRGDIQRVVDGLSDRELRMTPVKSETDRSKQRENAGLQAA